MSTLVKYLLAAVLQFIGLNMPAEEETPSLLTHQQCETPDGLTANTFIISTEQLLKTSKNES